jgi:succinate dehydrogenase/fumarate reductase cytochrome b subunit
MLSRMKAAKPTLNCGASPRSQRFWSLRALHRASAMLLAGFVLMHLGNHLAGLRGLGVHQAVMESLRALYRQPTVEAVLLAAVLFQVGSGTLLWWRGRGQRHGWVAGVQAASGLYLAFFLLVHVSAVLSARLQGVDTNFYFAAAGVHVAPFYLFFVPYYFLAVLAFWTHAACGLYWNLPPRHQQPVLAAMLLVGVLMAGTLALWLAGGIYPIDIPAPYLASFPASLRGAGL